MMPFLMLAADSQSFAGSLLESAHGIGENFGVNWMMLLSDSLSVLLVAWLLNKFAYKPVLSVLERRRQTIAEGLENAAKIKKRLAEAEAKYQETLAKANVEAQRMIEEARTSSNALAEKRAQAAISEAEQIIAKARQNTEVEREKMLTELKREVSRLVVDTTSKVSGKVLTSDDQKRLAEETARQVAA